MKSLNWDYQEEVRYMRLGASFAPDDRIADKQQQRQHHQREEQIRQGSIEECHRGLCRPIIRGVIHQHRAIHYDSNTESNSGSSENTNGSKRLEVIVTPPSKNLRQACNQADHAISKVASKAIPPDQIPEVNQRAAIKEIAVTPTEVVQPKVSNIVAQQEAKSPGNQTNPGTINYPEEQRNQQRGQEHIQRPRWNEDDEVDMTQEAVQDYAQDGGDYLG